MLFIAGFICWLSAWAIAIPDAPGWKALLAAVLSWLGLVIWELILQDYRKGKLDRS
jgi:hypothetical protein